MTSALIAIALLVVVGLPLATWLEPSLRWRARIGVAFMIGSGVTTLLMLLATFAGIRWSFALIGGGLAAVAIAALPFTFALTKREVVPESSSPLVVAADLATLACLTGYALFATVARPWEWDFWAIWGLKAKEFLLAGGVNFEFLFRSDNFYSHPDYPPLVPLMYDLVALVQGRWDDRWMGLIAVAFAAAAILVMREELARQSGSPLVGALGALALSAAACSPWVGLGEGPLVALSASGLLILSRGLRDDSTRAIATGSILLGVAGLAKNEGVSFVIAAALVTLVIARDKWARVALPATAVMAPWLVARLIHSATTDVFEGGFASRFAERLSDPAAFLAALAKGHFERPEMWLILVLVLALRPAVVRRERFLLGVVGLQTLSYLAVYAGTVNDLASHVQSSVGRVSSHLAPLVGIVAVLGIGELMKLAPDSTPERENEVEPET